jgi:pimeloyl-ACP methyl ester carboxylesterase
MRQQDITKVYPDPPDLRDRMYTPTMRSLKAHFNSFPFDDQNLISRIKNQKQTMACTGFALSAMVELLMDVNWQQSGRVSERADAYSPFMLFRMARRYDELPGEDAKGGSTARGAMKAWHKHGACRERFWLGLEEPKERKWMNDAFHAPLGAYYRVDHTSIPDMHAAINEVGAIFATAYTHTGWSELFDQDQKAFDATDETRTLVAEKTQTKTGRGSGKLVKSEIPFDSKHSAPSGGHAFLIVGYDAEGFWIQNSYGTHWGRQGFARMRYADWRANGMDAWIGQLGVHVSQLALNLSDGLQFDRVRPAAHRGAAGGIDLISSSPAISAQQINPYIVNLGNNGVLSDAGQFCTIPEDLEQLVSTYLEMAIGEQGWKLGKEQTIDIAVYAHGGLVAESSAADIARNWVPGLFANKIFPIFMMWETGPLETVQHLVDDAFKPVPGAAGGDFWQRTQEWLDDRLEALVGRVGKSFWDDMKQNARLASRPAVDGFAGGGMLELIKAFGKLPEATRARLRFHLIGHSAGAIFAAHALGPILEAGFKVDGLYLMAPAIGSKAFDELVVPYFDQKSIKRFCQFQLDDLHELGDNCLTLYQKSLLYLVSNAFEGERKTPILGMEVFAEQAPKKRTGMEWDVIVAPNTAKDVIEKSQAQRHGDFDNDPDTMLAILTRIARVQAKG